MLNSKLVVLVGECCNSLKLKTIDGGYLKRWTNQLDKILKQFSRWGIILKL